MESVRRENFSLGKKNWTQGDMKEPPLFSLSVICGVQPLKLFFKKRNWIYNLLLKLLMIALFLSLIHTVRNHMLCS